LDLYKDSVIMVDSLKILVGKVVAPQGIHGELRVQTFSEKPTDFKFLKIYTEKFTNSQIHFVRQLNTTSSVVILRIDTVVDRNIAETLRGMEFFIDRDSLSKLKNNEYYQSDLIGFKVIRNGIVLGCVDCFQNFGAGDIIELKNGDLVSFIGADVDVLNKTIAVL